MLSGTVASCPDPASSSTSVRWGCFFVRPDSCRVATTTNRRAFSRLGGRSASCRNRSDDVPAGGYTYVTVGRLDCPNRTAWVTARPAARSGYVPWSSTLLIDVWGSKRQSRSYAQPRLHEACLRTRGVPAPVFVLHVLGSPSPDSPRAEFSSRLGLLPIPFDRPALVSLVTVELMVV
jgi:hypothetical protein